MRPPQHREGTRVLHSAPMPPRWVEYAYYLSLLYSMIAPGLGLEVPLLGSGLVLLLGASCIVRLRSYAKRLYAPIGLLIACTMSYVLIQVSIHDESLMGDSIRAFILVTLHFVIVCSLCFRRGFSLRFPIFLFVIGAMSLPFLAFELGAVERARVDVGVIQGNFSHPNGLAEWFGFCAVYFTITGIEAKQFTHRIGAWLLAAGCLLVLTLAVSRGPLFGAALAITFAFRGLLKRGFIPLFVLIVLAGVLSLSGIFDSAVSHYSERGMQESGRELLWPAAIERISESPIFGVGVSNAQLYVLSTKHPNPPHNSFLFFALASGVVPLAFYTAFWIHAAWSSAVCANRRKDSLFRIPYLLFTFVCAMLGDTTFMSTWAIFALCVAAGSAAIYDDQRLIVVRAGNKVRLGLVPRLDSREAHTVARSRF